jgi:hypothetical protein
VFFWLYSQTVRQLRGYHDSLLSVQNVLLSFKLVSETKDPKEKGEMVSRMCRYLLVHSVSSPSMRPAASEADDNSEQSVAPRERKARAAGDPARD